MISKQKIHILGWITLLVFPIPAFLVLHFREDYSLSEFLKLEDINIVSIGLGIELGVAFAFLALLLLSAPVFDKLPNRVELMVKQMNLNVFDAFFLSMCAGVGEELLFRVGLQFYLGPIITSIIFIAIHGYFNPWNWRMSLYGVILLPFILLISFGFYEFGLWFSIAAHFAYDFVLFMSIRSSD